MVRLRRVERRFAAAESLRRITRGLPAFTPLKSGERGTVVDAGPVPGAGSALPNLAGLLVSALLLQHL